MTEKRKTRSLPASFDVYSTVHKGTPCTDCILCKDTQPQYTHPTSWKNKELILLLRRLEPDKIISPDSCICRNCRDSLSNGLKDPANFQPRWRKENKSIAKCQVLQCIENDSQTTNITSREHINDILPLIPISPSSANSSHTNLCDNHYRTLHRYLNPQNYNYKCTTCGISLQHSPLGGFRHCPNPTLVLEHLQKHTGFEGDINPTDKVCDSCY